MIWYYLLAGLAAYIVIGLIYSRIDIMIHKYNLKWYTYARFIATICFWPLVLVVDVLTVAGRLFTYIFKGILNILNVRHIYNMNTKYLKGVKRDD